MNASPLEPLAVNQNLVDEIIARAASSRWGLEKTKQSISIDQYAQTDEHALAMILVSGWDAKYDLVSLFAAAIQVVREKELQSKI